MRRILLWLLPVVDVFALKRILEYYRVLGVDVPWRHVKLGMVERWAGYVPVAALAGLVFGFWMSLLIFLVFCAIFGTIELYLMRRGTWPWKFFKGKPPKLVTKVFLLEIYNVAGYFVLGVGLGSLIRTLFLG